jgi:hypothetical protein
VSRGLYFRKLSRPAQLRRLARNKRLRCDCEGWPFYHRTGSRSLSSEFPGCTKQVPRW